MASTGDPTVDAILAQLTGGGGGMGSDPVEALLGVDPSASVFWGQSKPRGGGTRGGANWTDDTHGRTSGTRTDKLKNVGTLFGDFYKWDEKQLRGYQHELYVAGYYGDIDPEQIGWGQQNDQASYQAWQRLVVDASRYYAVGKKLTPRDVLNLAKQRAGMEPDDGDDGEGGGPTYAQLSDPVALAKDVDEAAKKVLGRGATAEEKRLFASVMHSKQRQTAAQIKSGQKQGKGKQDRLATAEALAAGMAPPVETDTTDSGMVDVVNYSPEARAEEFARSQDPVRADARKVVEKFQYIADAFRKGAV